MGRPLWTPDDAELALRASDGQQWAFEELVDRHADLIHFSAREFYAPGETYDDLLQSARVALYKAARTFDPSRGVTFRTFAGLAVRAELITTVTAAQRGKHGPLNESDRFERVLRGEGDDVTRTLAEIVPAPEAQQPDSQVIAREELERLIDLAHTRLSPLEQAVLVRRLNGGNLTECGAGLGTSAQGAAKTADNALQRIRLKLAA